MSVASMSRETKRSYLKLCHEKQQKKKDFMPNELKDIEIYKFV